MDPRVARSRRREIAGWVQRQLQVSSLEGMAQLEPTRRQLGILGGAALVVSSMVGTGIYSTTGLLIRDLGAPALVLLVWAVGGVVAAAGALTYGRLSTAIPLNGGEYVILTRLYHPVCGFVAGWITIFAGFAAPLAAAAAAFSDYAGRYSGGLPKELLALLAVWTVTALHLRGTGFGSKMQILIALIQVLLMTAFVVAGVACGDSSRLLAAPRSPSVTVFSPEFARALVYVFYAYTGYNAAIYTAGEVKQPERSLPRALLLGTAIVTLLYLLINVVYLVSAPMSQLSGVVDVGAVAVEYLLGRAAGIATALLVCVGLVGFISAMTFAGPRVLAAITEDYPRLSCLSPRTEATTPVRATLLQSALASLLVLTASFNALLTYVGLMLSLTALLGIIGVFRLKHQLSRYAPSYGIAFAAVMAALLLGWSIVATAMLSPRSALTAGLTVVIAGAGYRWARGKG
jgi:basic amino acid/polyamine antiporter, APA family